jgi:hypothetical protein
MKPWMEDYDIEILEDALLSFGNKKIDVLEWGSGGSTVYFTRFLKTHVVDYSWLSIEYDKVWFDKIRNILMNDTFTELVLFNLDYNNPSSINRDEYVSFPRKLGKKYDIIIVDGRQRARCLIEAKFLLKPNGLVFLHDAERTKYHYAFTLFKNSKIVSPLGPGRKLWKGSLD